MTSKSTRVVSLLMLLLAAAGGGFAWWQSRGAAPADTALSLYGTVDVREVHLGFHEVEHIVSVHAEGRWCMNT